MPGEADHALVEVVQGSVGSALTLKTVATWEKTSSVENQAAGVVTTIGRRRPSALRRDPKSSAGTRARSPDSGTAPTGAGGAVGAVRCRLPEEPTGRDQRAACSARSASAARRFISSMSAILRCVHGTRANRPTAQTSVMPPRT